MNASQNVGQNTYEVWKLTTGGGWFHPIHIHLISFFVLFRNDPRNAGNLEVYEQMSPKDVVQLHPSTTIYVVAR
jgi:spore coat protein A, manganese oxidase